MKPDDEIRGLAFDALDLKNKKAAVLQEELVKDVFTNTIREVNAKTLPTKGLANGTFVGYYCLGFDKVGIYANGYGGTYDQTLQTQSRECGYDQGFSTAVRQLTVEDRQKLFRG